MDRLLVHALAVALLFSEASLGKEIVGKPCLMSNSALQQVVSAMLNSSSLVLDPDKRDVTPEERSEFIQAHNGFRRNVNPAASNMREMSWDNGLESMAQGWADLCEWRHGQPPTTDPPFNPIGQNLWAGTGGYTPTGAVTLWHSEEADYDYDSNTCSNVCGHYTQVVWATSYALGCGIRFCPNLVGAFQNAYFIVCNYGPAGNWVGQKPYTQGGRCSDCPSAAPNCNNNLCASSDLDRPDFHAVGNPQLRIHPVVYTDGTSTMLPRFWIALLVSLVAAMFS